MRRIGDVDLSKLPPPTALEEVDWRVIVSQMKVDLLQRFPEAEDVIEDELEPLVYLIENYGAREMVLRAGWNEKVRSVLLPLAQGSNLDNVAAGYGVERMVVQAADPSLGRGLVMESDERLRSRTRDAIEAYSTAGSHDAYVFQAKTANARVEDVAAYSHESGLVKPGKVLIVIKTDDESGGPMNLAPADPQAALTDVSERLSRPSIKPLTDMVAVKLANRLIFNEEVVLRTLRDPGTTGVINTATKRWQDFIKNRSKIGVKVPWSGRASALHVPGVVETVEFDPLLRTDLDPGPLSVYVPGTFSVTALRIDA